MFIFWIKSYKTKVTFTAVSFRPCLYGSRVLHNSCCLWWGRITFSSGSVDIFSRKLLNSSSLIFMAVKISPVKKWPTLQYPVSFLSTKLMSFNQYCASTQTTYKVDVDSHHVRIFFSISFEILELWRNEICLAKIKARAC